MKEILNNEFFVNQSTNRGYLLTEANNPKSQDLDLMSTSDIVKLFCEEDKQAQSAVASALPSIISAVEAITNCIRNKGRMFYIGAGTSGRLAVLDAAECPPTFCTPPDLVQAIIAGGECSLTRSSEQLEDDPNQSIQDLLSRGFNQRDCLVGISAGGTTPYVINALKYSRAISAVTISICCVPQDQVKIVSDIDIRLVTGAEILSGSTRLKAGTATKMTLNILSTVVMVKLGKVFGNKMIDVSATNSKLIDRSLRIISEILDINRDESYKLLLQSKGSVKLALLMSMSGYSYNEAQQLLSISQDNLRTALKKLN